MEENEVDLTLEENKENPPEPAKKKRSYKNCGLGMARI